VVTVLKSGSFNLLELYVPVQACNGIALPLGFTLDIKISGGSSDDCRGEGLGEYISSKSHFLTLRDFNRRTSYKPFHMHLGSAAHIHYSINPSGQ
jgi:hypothetical protein